MRRGALLALAVALLFPARPAAGLEPGNHRVSIQHGGRPRSYIVHVPPAARDGQSLPVVLSFHGGGGNAENQQKYSRMDPVADVEGFLAVEASDRVAVIALVAGAKVLKVGQPGRPVSVMHFHSVDDPRALYEGGAAHGHALCLGTVSRRRRGRAVEARGRRSCLARRPPGLPPASPRSLHRPCRRQRRDMALLPALHVASHAIAPTGESMAYQIYALKYGERETKESQFFFREASWWSAMIRRWPPGSTK